MVSETVGVGSVGSRMDGDVYTPAEPDIENVIHHSKIHHRNPIQEVSFLAF